MITKNKLIESFIFSILILFVTGCGEDARMHNMVDDTIYVMNYEENQVDVYDWGSFDYKLMVIKAGKGQFSTDVELVIDEQYLKEYNESEGTSYKLLPEDCYSISNKKVSFSKGDYENNFPIVFDTKKISDLQGKYNAEYVIPCRINSSNPAIQSLKPEMAYSLIIPYVKDPYIEFKSPGVLTPPISIDPRQKEVKSNTTLVTIFENLWDITYKIEVDPQLLDDYNATIGDENEKFILLPESAYSLDESTFVMKPNSNESNMEFTIIKEGLMDNGVNLFGNYILPLKIESVSKFQVNPDRSAQLVTVLFQPQNLDRSTWTVEASSEWIGGGEKENILDDNLDTYWHSQWEGGNAPLPHILTIDMKKEHDVMAIELVQRMWYTDVRLAIFETSLDNIEYTKVGEMFFDALAAEPSMQIAIPSTRARYVKCIITESNRVGNGAISEIYIKGLE